MYFLEGTESYRNEDWKETVELMEKALEYYTIAEDNCRFACEKPFDMGWFPDFITSVASKSKTILS